MVNYHFDSYQLLFDTTDIKSVVSKY